MNDAPLPAEGMADLTRRFLAGLPPDLATALRAASVPHWFDAGVLAAILDIDQDTAVRRCESLQTLPMLRRFGDNGLTVHELTRGPILDELWTNERDTYRLWSRRAADHFAALDAGDPLAILNDLLRRLDPAKAEVQKAKQSANPQARIESIYHRLLADPEQGADEVWSWGAEWHNTFQYALLHSLIQAGLEHDRAGRLAGRAKGWVYYLHGLLQTIYNEYRAAREALEIAAAYTGGDRQLEANCIQRLGDVHLRLAEYAEARRRYEQALPVYRDIGDRLGEANCIQSLGDVHLSLAEYAEARRRYEQALPVYRDIGARLGEANCIKSLGDVHRMLAEYAEARRRYEQAFDRFLDLGLPNDAVGVLVSQAGIYERQYDYEAALPLYVRAVELAPDNPMWYRNRASAYLNLKDPAGAAADIETAARLQPDHPYLHLRRGDLAILQGDYDRALAEFAAFVAAFPSNNGGYFSKTRAHLLRGDSAAALAALDQALALTYEAQDVRDAIYEMEQLQSEHGHLPGLAEALSRLRAWRRQ